jgi:Fe2+ or Zn2+ uptake regulation protein
MAAPAAVLNVLVTANTKGAMTGLARVNTRLAATGAAAGKTQGAMLTMAKTAAKVGAGLGAAGLAFGVKKAFDEFREAEKATAQTNAVLKSTGHAANVTAKEIENLATAISNKAGIDDEAIQSAANMLLTFKDIRNEAGAGNRVFDQTTRIVTDMSVAMDQGLKQSSIQVGKALNDPIRGLTSLGRVGVQFTDQQRKQIEALVESGEKMKAQKIILKELRSEFGGSAAAQADNADKLRVAWDNMFESIGKSIGPWIENAMGNIAKFIRQMSNGKGAGGEFARTMKSVFKVVGDVIHEVYVSFRNFIKWFGNAIHNIERFGKGVKRIMGDAIAFILRRVADMFEVLGRVPIIGDKFRGVAKDINRAADKVDKLGENIKDLPIQKTLKLRVKLAMEDLSGVPRLRDLSQGGPEGGVPSTKVMMSGIQKGGQDRVRQWVLDNLDKLAPLMGAPGSAKGGLGVAERLGHAFGLVTSSGYRPGDDGWHGKNRARDLAGPASAMMKYARALFSRMGSRLLELIYTPMGIGIKNGQPVNIRSFYGSAVAADHFDHVHVAMQRGGGVGGTGSGDKVPALLEPGEFVMNRKAARVAGPLLAALNKGIPRFARGGLVAKAAFMAGFRGDNLLRAVAEAKGESGWDENAVGDGGKSIGLMQIHTGFNPWARGMNLRNPFANMRAAYKIWKSQGWGAWYADHTPHIAAARAAIAGMRAFDERWRGRGGGGGGGGGSSPFHSWDFAPGTGGTFGWGQETPVGTMPNSPLRNRLGAKEQRRLERINQPMFAPGTQGASDFLSNMFGIIGGRQDMNRALAALTPDKADDIAVAMDAIASWTNWLDIAKQNNDVAGITTAATNLGSWQDELTRLTEDQNDLLEQQIEAQKSHTQALTELKDQQKRNEDLIRAQGPALTGALIQMVNGGIGGKAGLGKQFPSSTGLGGLSRA